MVILLQLCIFVVFAVIRGQELLGNHLQPASKGSRVLSFLVESRGTRYARHVGLALPGAIPFVVRRERAYHRLLKFLGIASEVQVGNADFDRRYFITTDVPGHLEQLLASKDLQAHIHALLSLPVTSLHATRRRLWCVIAREDFRKPDSYFDQHLDLLRSIFDAGQASPAGERPPLAAHWRGPAALSVIATHGGLLMLGALGFFATFADSVHTLDLNALVVTGAAAGALMAAIWLPSILALFSGSSWSAWVFADFLLCGFIGFVLSGVSVVRNVNLQLPQPQARVYQQPVNQKICVLQCRKAFGRRPNRSSYLLDPAADCSPLQRQAVMAEKQHADPICASSAWFKFSLEVKDWRDQQTYTFGASEQLFDAVTPGETVAVPVHPGALGLEWVDWDEISGK